MASHSVEDEYSYEKINEPYYFETDHVALKENSDYRNLLHAIALLEAQRMQAARDVDDLYKAQDEALADPVFFVEKLQRGENLALPRPQNIAALPVIHWDKYTSSASFYSFGTSQHATRNKKCAGDVPDSSVQNIKTALAKGTSTTAVSASASSEQTNSDSDLVIVRGRVKDSLKPATFNQLWTEEEQQKLERLLIQFPPEEIESKRWGKIATALGNRTPQQVASRVQKYFLRLAKEGLPIPGRMPSLSAHSKKGSHRHHRYNRLYYPNSTLMQSYNPPVWMTEDDVEQGTNISGFAESSYAEMPKVSEADADNGESSDEDNLPDEIINSPEYQELMRLKEMRKKLIVQEQTSFTKHIGYRCDRCDCEPIVGTRWHCIDCPVDMSLDFCDSCSDISFQKNTHDSSHRLHPYRNAVLDSDYMSHSNADYNYLDTNFMPAT